MQMLENLNLKPAKVFKIAGLVIVGVIVIALLVRLVNPAFRGVETKMGAVGQSMPSFGAGVMMYDTKGYTEMASDNFGLSVRNVVGNIASTPSINNSVVVGDDAEDFEVTQFNANVETRNLKQVCDQVVALKSRTEVIFENAVQNEKSCYYTFKVKRDKAEEILGLVKSLDPKELNENTYTIKQLLDDYTSRVEILENKMNSIEETLSNATAAYDGITDLAVKTQNVESLAKIIDSKLNLIERLTMEKINVSAQLEQLKRSKAEQTDRLDYTYFNINVVENKFIDWRNIGDSWKITVKAFVSDLNEIVQDVTINLIRLILIILQYAIYLLIILVVAKYGFKIGKNIWQR